MDGRTSGNSMYGSTNKIMYLTGKEDVFLQKPCAIVLVKEEMNVDWFSSEED